MSSIPKSLALGCALGIAGCAQTGVSSLPAGPAAGAPSAHAPAFHLLRSQIRDRSGSNPLLYNFQGPPDGNDPVAGLVNFNGTLYGTTEYGGADNLGAVFAITTTGSESIVHSFSGADGEYPQASLINVNGTLYGTTAEGSGSNSYGNVFSVTPSSPSAGFKVVIALTTVRAMATSRWPRPNLVGSIRCDDDKSGARRPRRNERHDGRGFLGGRTRPLPKPVTIAVLPKRKERNAEHHSLPLVQRSGRRGGQLLRLHF